MKPSLLYSFLVLLSGSLLIGCSTVSVPSAESSNSRQDEVVSILQRPGGFEAPAPPSSSSGAETEEQGSSKNYSVSQTVKVANSPVKKEAADDDQSLLDTALDLIDTAQEYWEDNDVDKAYESLDEAYALILSVPNNPKYAQQKEDIRFTISKRIIEMSASRQVAVKGSHNEIPMLVNDHVMREIQSFQTIEKDFFLESYKRSGRYRGDMVKALKAAGLPEELSWLPLIESGFKTRALSRSRAFGLWQFIPSTGYKFGLKRNAWIDERLDPDKATA